MYTGCCIAIAACFQPFVIRVVFQAFQTFHVYENFYVVSTSGQWHYHLLFPRYAYALEEIFMYCTVLYSYVGSNILYIKLFKTQPKLICFWSSRFRSLCTYNSGISHTRFCLIFRSNFVQCVTSVCALYGGMGTACGQTVAHTVREFN